VSILPFPAWSRNCARLEGALPFLSPTLAGMLAQRSLRRLWASHVQQFPFEDRGLEHNPGLEAGELIRSWQTRERQDFCAWITRRGAAPLAEAARSVLRAKAASETYASLYEPAERALARLDALLPSHDPLGTLVAWIDQLRTQEIDFLEGGTETHLLLDHAWDRPAPRGAAWAASLALSLRPQLFSLGAAPLALAHLAPRGAFRAELEQSVESWLVTHLDRATTMACRDLELCRQAEILGAERLAPRNSSSCAHRLWPLLVGLGPLTRAEVARTLGVTKATASQAVEVLREADLVSLRPDGAILVRGLRASTYERADTCW